MPQPYWSPMDHFNFNSMAVLWIWFTWRKESCNYAQPLYIYIYIYACVTPPFPREILIFEGPSCNLCFLTFPALSFLIPMQLLLPFLFYSLTKMYLL